MDHLKGGNRNEAKLLALLHPGDAAMADKIHCTAEREVGALVQTLIQASDLFFVKTGIIQLAAGAQFKFLAGSLFIMAPAVQPTLMVAFEQDNVGLILDREQESDDIRIFHAAVNIIAAEDIQTVILQAAKLLEHVL